MDLQNQPVESSKWSCPDHLKWPNTEVAKRSEFDWSKWVLEIKDQINLIDQSYWSYQFDL